MDMEEQHGPGIDFIKQVNVLKASVFTKSSPGHSFKRTASNDYVKRG